MKRSLAKHPITTVAILSLFTAFAAACAGTAEDDVEGSEGALSAPQCEQKKKDAKTSAVGKCKTTRDQAEKTSKTCSTNAKKKYDDFTAKVKAAAPEDATVKAALQECLDSQACAAREAIAKATGKPVSQIESTGLGCTIAQWFTSLTSSCNGIDAEDVGTPEYRALVKQISAKEKELEADTKKCHDAVDNARIEFDKCEDLADDKAKDAYRACRKDCGQDKGTACVPEGEKVACGVIKDEGFLDTGCSCKSTKVCGEYKKLAEELKKDADEGTRCADADAGIDGNGMFQPVILKDKKGAPTSVVKRCVAVPTSSGSSSGSSAPAGSSSAAPSGSSSS